MWQRQEAAGTAVIYETRTGTCRWYAERIADRREAELFEVRQAKHSVIKGFRTLVWILPVYDGHLEGLDSLTSVYPKLMKVTRSYADDLGGAGGEKRIALLAVGLADEKAAFASGALDLPEVLENVPLFYARGRLIRENLDWKGQMRLEILEKAPENTVPAWAADIIHKDMDLTEEAYIDPVLDLIDGRF